MRCVKVSNESFRKQQLVTLFTQSRCLGSVFVNNIFELEIEHYISF